MKKIIFCLVFLCSLASASAQVMIGSKGKPAPGALLEVKPEGTAKLGVMLPRVSLSSLTQLKLGATSELVGQERQLHVGLMVFNTQNDPVNGLCPGVYVWELTTWKRLPTPCL